MLLSLLRINEIESKSNVNSSKYFKNYFQKTEISKQLEAEKQKNLFNSKDYVVDTIQAEHLYNQNNHFTLSVFITETRHTALLPNFEKENTFRFEKMEIEELIKMLGELTASSRLHEINNLLYQVSQSLTK